jgi:hypothetical protein
MLGETSKTASCGVNKRVLGPARVTQSRAFESSWSITADPQWKVEPDDRCRCRWWYNRSMWLHAIRLSLPQASRVLEPT